MESSFAREASPAEVGCFFTLNSSNLENGIGAFRLGLADGGMVTLTFDMPIENINGFSHAVFSELNALLDQLVDAPAKFFLFRQPFLLGF